MSDTTSISVPVSPFLEGVAKQGLLSMLRNDWQAHGRDWTRAGFRALAVYRFGVWRMSARPWPLRKALSLAYRILERRVRVRYGIELPYSAKVGNGVVIEHQNCIVIHGSARIGDRCVIRQGVTIGNKGRSDPYGAPVIGDDVDIGANAVIVGRITVGNGARIAAGAMVAKDVPPGALAIGNPASIVERC